MIVLDTHIVNKVKQNIRFVDYAIGIFQGFETKNAVKKGIKEKRFALNGTFAETGAWVKVGDRVELLERSLLPKAYDMEVSIVYEDDDLAVVIKPAGLVVSGNRFKTLEHALIDQFSLSKASDALPWGLPVHRLDAPTSGLVIFAKTMSSRRKLGEQLKNKEIQKTYVAVVHGTPKDGDISEPIDGKVSLSRLKRIRTVPSLKNDTLSMVELQPITGRTHQLRIHCALVGCPIVGDQLYGNDQGTFKNKGLLLAATKLVLQHPRTGQPLTVEITIPNKFESLLKREKRRAERHIV